MRPPDRGHPLYGPFWAGGDGGLLHLPVCRACEAMLWPPSEICPTCWSSGIEWADLPGDGTVWSVAEYHHAYDAASAAEVPYQCILVELDCGPRMISRYVSAPSTPASHVPTRPGQRVKAVRADLPTAGQVPCFADAEATGA